MYVCMYESYLQDKSQPVQLSSASSDDKSLCWGVPQGSVLGPALYTLYTAPLSLIVGSHGLEALFFTDDSQLYVTFRPLEASDTLTMLAKQTACIEDIKRWMLANMLKLNDCKTDCLVISSPSVRSKITVQPIPVGDCLIEPSPSVRNLGVIFDQDMNLQAHVQRVCQTCYMHLRNISAIRGALTMKSAECLIHALVFSRLDFCNSLLAEIPDKTPHKLQTVQNSAARILTCASRYEHTTPICYRLHWLPVAYRVKYKVLLLVYKALNNAAPDYISDLLQHRQIRARLQSSDEVRLEEPVFRLKNYGYRSFRSVGPSY